MRLLYAVLACLALGILLQLTGHKTEVTWLFSGFSLVVAGKLTVGMVNKLRTGHYGVDILAITAIVSTILVGESWATIIIVLMLTSGEALETYAAGRAKHELSALLKRAPQTAHLLVKGDTKTVPITSIQIGDQLLVKPGEVVPVDATLASQRAEIDESSLTGESLPVDYKKGMTLLSGGINGSQAITITATKTSQDSQFQQIIKLVKEAMSVQAPFVRLADRYAVPFTIISFAIAGLAWAISGEALRFAEVLVVATPCPLLLAAPIALVSGMSRAAKNGIIIKSGAILEKLATVRSVAFDKTGTLTKGQLTISRVLTASSFTSDDVIRYAASVEQHSAHILTKALISEARKRHLTLVPPTNLQESVAQGITAKVKNKQIVVGKAAFLNAKGITIPAGSTAIGETAAYVAINNTYAGTIVFSDHIRRDAKATIQRLHRLGIRHLLMLTGDARAIAARIAKQIGIDNIHAECLPADKVTAVKQAPHHPIMMVGDGVNDAPVLAAADVGMAMGARGSTAASETADVVVLVDDITKSADAIRIARHTIAIALQSVWVGIIISIVLMIIAALGFIPAIIGAFLQEAVDVIVILNALRAHGSSRP